MGRLLQDLKNWGLALTVVVTDGSSLHPALPADLRSAAYHQLSVFHAIKDVNKLVLDAVRRRRDGRRSAAA